MTRNDETNITALSTSTSSKKRSPIKISKREGGNKKRMMIPQVFVMPCTKLLP